MEGPETQALEKFKEIYLDTGWKSQDAYVKCPICGYEYSHISGVSNEYLLGNYGAAIIGFAGECGHEWAVIYDSHKGSVINVVIAYTPEKKEFVKEKSE